MRRRPSKLGRALVTAACLTLGASRVAPAQSGIAVEGAPDLILPTGARSLGMGQAVAATAIGAEALWWNPAGVARGPREFSSGFVTNVLAPATDLNVAFVYPVPKVMTLALSVRYVNTGQQPAVDTLQQVTGSFYPLGWTVTGTFAAPFGDRLNVGLNLKLFQVGFACTGSCDLPSGTPLTGALDFGAQYKVTKDSVFAVGLSVRNVGLPLQINDSPQADALPGRLDAGVAFTPKLTQYPQARVTIAADVVTRLSGEGGPGFRVGGELSWLKQYFARGGYVVEGPSGGSGPSFGVGVARGRWRVDFAQFIATSGDVAPGTKPTYLTLRYVF
jgi:hypothetical protein